jgi:Leucine-rich repeat (LRR) protein
MRNPFLITLCERLAENDPRLDVVSLIKLPTWQASTDEFRLLSSALAGNTTIRWLELGLDESTTTLDLSVLAFISSLHTLVIRVTSCTEALENALSAIWKIPNLHRVDLQWMGQSMPSVATQQDIFRNLARVPSISLKGFRLEPGDIEPLSWQELVLDSCDLTSATSLEWLPTFGSRIFKLYISNSQLSTSSLRTMAESYNNLRVLDLSRNNLTELHCPSLCELLDSAPNLLSLSLADNPEIGDIGIHHVCETVSHRIQQLDLSNCQISKSLTMLVDTFPFLEAINLSENPMSDFLSLQEASKLKELVLESLPSGLGNLRLVLDRWNAPQSFVALERMDLSGNHLTEKDLASVGACRCKILVLADCRIDNDGFSTLLSSSRHTFWTELHLSYNRIGDGVSKTWAENLARLQSLRYLSLDNNRFNNEGLRAILDVGLPHRLEYLNIQSRKVKEEEKSDEWKKLLQQLRHQLLLNRAGKSLLFSKSLSSCLVPWILAEAQSVYGKDAVFDFLRSKPDMIARP